MPESLTRRELLLLLMTGCAVAEVDYRNARLGARPQRSSGGSVEAGATSETIPTYIPGSVKKNAPLILALHGAGGRGARFIQRFTSHADRIGAIVVAPDSRDRTWDFHRQIGPDVEFIDHALSHVFAQHAIDRRHLCVAGYSDGASYALTLGLTNGEIFSHVIAFSAGSLLLRTPSEDKPHVFLSHGRQDDILPIDPCGRAIAASLRRHNYDLTYREFDGTHVLQDDIVSDAMKWFAG